MAGIAYDYRKYYSIQSASHATFIHLSTVARRLGGPAVVYCVWAAPSTAWKPLGTSSLLRPDTAIHSPIAPMGTHKDAHLPDGILASGLRRTAATNVLRAIP
jgi:hypothetical protein